MSIHKYFDENKLLHREDGPSYVNNNVEYWYIHGKKHRDGGPAVVCKHTGEEYWYHEGRIHRDDGPAIIYDDGSVEWWIYGVQINFETYCRSRKLSGEEIFLLKLKYVR